MSSFVSYEFQENGIAIVTLNRPETANALSTSLLNELSELLGDLAFRKDIRVVIVTGAGEKVFCAGADLKERAGMNETEVRKTVALIRETINQVEQLPQPVIAVLNGSAFGGGLELALACDIRVAVDTAQLGLTETSLGIIPGAGGTQRLPRLIGKGKAKELIFTAKRITAQEAAQIGLVEYVVPRAQLMEKALEIAGQIAANAPIAVRQAKLAVNRGLDVDLATGLRLEQMAYEVTIPTKDRLEGLQAFKEKRKPVYKGE
ncbi:enoyl-CoA hydratase [Saccharococcus caldoxylosilyticus]|jgi:methylglutaconyl-CoA hydratase|uniref:Methylglutaconyl-CoA hydratase n=1 Tax=Saccharococcus caldoxylosilyticus TaxID=81408 RepID=A0A150LU71_9BACL|nr:enoyl-CoA hydratase [Parageobacillus caldoxylosilyticus]KYD15858.1 Methylglutaconyl-CoA hydratase [Parageobacillus caldoxylosilyticus]QXJ36851.1 putative enoyl-CoA hydratase echA8 [Parageobacillus caldoxylosilyticus]BDG43231.1 enoyl-CoA hydratase [Parageobacillus caldoxylosilyticus]